MSRPAPAPDGNALRRAASRDRVIEAAIRLIAEQGFSDTSVEEIAAAAGVAKGTVFYNFGSKEQLFVQVLREGLQRLAVRFVEAASGRHGLDAVAAMVRTELEAIHTSPAMAQVLVAELFRPNRPWQAALRELREEAVAPLRAVLEDGRERGELEGDLDVDAAAGALLGSVLVMGLDWLAFSPHRSLADVEAQVIRMFAGDLLPRPS
ncbi:MAG: TetR/AcrR family transcriptional regulator [Kineosporiaceae bacterium]